MRGGRAGGQLPQQRLLARLRWNAHLYRDPARAEPARNPQRSATGARGRSATNPRREYQNARLLQSKATRLRIVQEDRPRGITAVAGRVCGPSALASLLVSSDRRATGRLTQEGLKKPGRPPTSGQRKCNPPSG